TKEAREIQKRALPFIALIEEACAKDPDKTIQIFCEIMYSYSEIQHSAYSRDIEYKKEDDYVKRFNLLFDEYRFRYEELFNRLVSIVYGCVGIVINEPPVDGMECINIDANKKLKRLNSSILPSSTDYESISVAISGIKIGIRNALSHGGRRTQLPNNEKFLLQDSSGWKQKYSLKEFHNELDVLNRVIVSLEFGALVINMNYVKEIAKAEKKLPHEFTQEQKNQILFSSAQDCQFEMLDAESNASFLEIKLLFSPTQPRESEFFGSWLGTNLAQKIPARPVELKGQIYRFVYYSSIILEKATPSMRIEIYTWGDKLLARAEIRDVKGFNEATKEIKGYDDYKTKKCIEKSYVKWERFSWATGEIGKDGKPIQD
ncbi:hypothetical protein L6250_01535, partial [Candidatus Parcubacteria bacterium]|nr:hypothetical protein [Candidatus Parcubacteria bacterium]